MYLKTKNTIIQEAINYKHNSSLFLCNKRTINKSKKYQVHYAPFIIFKIFLKLSKMLLVYQNSIKTSKTVFTKVIV